MRSDQVVMLWWLLGACFLLVFGWALAVLISVVANVRPLHLAWVQPSDGAVLTATLRWRRMRTGWLVMVDEVRNADGYALLGWAPHGMVLCDPFEISRVPYLAVRRVGKQLQAIEWRTS